MSGDRTDGIGDQAHDPGDRAGGMRDRTHRMGGRARGIEVTPRG